MRRAATMIFLSALVALPASAFGQDNSAVDQYREKTPSAGGDKPTGTDGASTGTDAPAAPLPPESAKALRASGSDGAATAKLAQATAPPPSVGEATETPGSEGDSEDGLGALLWVALAGALLAAVTFALIRSGRGPDQPAGG